jgi:hypothetical protein
MLNLEPWNSLTDTRNLKPDEASDQKPTANSQKPAASDELPEA